MPYAYGMNQAFALRLRFLPQRRKTPHPKKAGSPQNSARCLTKGALPHSLPHHLYSLIFFYSLLLCKSVFRTSYLHNALKASAKTQPRLDAVSAVIGQNKSLKRSLVQFGAIATFLNAQQVDPHKSYFPRFLA